MLMPGMIRRVQAVTDGSICIDSPKRAGEGAGLCEGRPAELPLARRGFYEPESAAGRRK
jgi:hypothetical protein